MFQWEYFPLWPSSWSSTWNTGVVYSFSISPCLCWTVSSSIATSFAELIESWWGEVFEFDHLARSKTTTIFLICSPCIATLTSSTEFRTNWKCNYENNLLLKWDTATWWYLVLCTILLITMHFFAILHEIWLICLWPSIVAEVVSQLCEVRRVSTQSSEEMQSQNIGYPRAQMFLKK